MDYNKVLSIVEKTGKVGFDEAELSDELKIKWLTIWSMGLAGEIAEMYVECDQVNYDGMLDELADVCWYTVAIDKLLGRELVKKIEFIDYQEVCRRVHLKIEHPRPIKPLILGCMLIALRYTETAKKYAEHYPRRSIESVIGYHEPLVNLNGVLDFDNVADRLSTKLQKRYPNGFI